VAIGRKKDDNQAENDVIDSYQVIYRGGLRELPKPKIGKIKLELRSDRFRLSADNNVASKFWPDMEIPYESVSAVDIVDRNVSTFEALAGRLNSRQLNQKNNININFAGSEGATVLRLEMLTGVTVMGQAKKCLEFNDRLQTHHIREKFAAVTLSTASPPTSAVASLADEMRKLAELRESGVLSQDEFTAAKARLLE